MRHTQVTLFRAEAPTLKCLFTSSGRRDRQLAKAATVNKEAGYQESMWEETCPAPKLLGASNRVVPSLRRKSQDRRSH